MLSIAIILSLLGSAVAIPLDSWPGPYHGPSSSSALSIDLNGLPPPTGNSSSPIALRHVVLGVGYQNYSCSLDSSSAPTPIGAVANLFDIKHLLDFNPAFKTFITPKALQFSGLKSEILPPTSPPQRRTLPPSNHHHPPFFPFFRPPFAPCPPIGEHFFSSPAGLPTFNLHSISPSPSRIEATKLASKPAPANAANQGADGQSAVDWLELGASGNPADFGGLKLVYRVETAGGKAPVSCRGLSGVVVKVPYAAEYWFYGDEGGEDDDGDD